MEKDLVTEPSHHTFKEKLSNFLETVEDKTNEIYKKERDLEEREKIVDKIIKNIPTECLVELRVGNILYCYPSNILCSSKDSYFHALLNPENGSVEDGTYFIPRDGEVFKYVLEYLTYGKLVSKINDRNILNKLVLDSEFYHLPELKVQAMEQVSLAEQIERKRGKTAYLKLDNGTLNGNGYFWEWSGHISVPDDYFSITTTSYTNDTINIKQDGDYLVTIRTNVKNSQDGVYLALYKNSNEIAKSYNNNLSASTQITEIFQFNSGDKLQVYQTYDSEPINGGNQNQVSILVLDS